MEDLEQIIGVKGLKKEEPLKWKSIAPSIISQAHLESKSKSVSAVPQMSQQ